MISDRGTYIVQLHRICCRIATIVHGCNYISRLNCSTSTIRVSVESSSTSCRIYDFVKFVAIFISVNHWSLSIFNYRLVIDSDVILVTFSCIISCRCRIVFINYFNGVVGRLNSCNFVFQLFNVYSICIVFTSFNINNFVTTIIKASVSQFNISSSSTRSCRCLNCNTVVINFCIASSQGSISIQVNVFSQLNFQFATNIVNTDIVSGSQLSFVCTTNDINYFIKMFLNNLWVSILVCLTVVTSELHAIIVSCYFMFVTVFVLVYDTSHSFTRLAVNAWNTIFYSDVSSCIFTIFTSRASQTNVTYAIFTGDRYCVFTVFTRDTNFTIVTICTSCALRASDCYTVLTVNAIFTINNYFIQVS